MRISDWSSDVCSSDRSEAPQKAADSKANIPTVEALAANPDRLKELRQQCKTDRSKLGDVLCNRVAEATRKRFYGDGETPYTPPKERSEEHTSELQSLMRISYAVFCLKKKKKKEKTIIASNNQHAT